mgnify:CR=1 FL=1
MASAVSRARRTVDTREFFDARGFVGRGGGMSIRFDEQKRFGVVRQTDVREGFDAGDGFPIEKLERAGNDLGGDDRGNGFGGGIHLRKGREQRLASGGLGQELEQHLGDDAERALAADEQVAQIVAGDVFHAFGAEPADRAVGENDL